MSEYKMNQYDLQSYFKSLCNSFYIAYEHVKRIEKEEDALTNDYNEEDLEMVNNLLKISVAESTQNKYITYKYSREELEKEKERLEAEKQEFDMKIEKLDSISKYWYDRMREEFENIKRVIYTIKVKGFSIIVTTKAEIYALLLFYNDWTNSVKKYPIVNMKEEYRQAFPTEEKIYDDFFYAYEEDMKCEESTFMKMAYDEYF